MNRIFMVFMALMFAMASVCAQEVEMDEVARQEASKSYEARYERLVSKLGVAGVGIETLLENWEGVDPENRSLVLAKYSYYVAKCQNNNVIPRPTKKYLGQSPLFTLKDSLGNDVNYFSDVEFDDSLFSVALRYADKAVKLFPRELDMYFNKAAALMSYEKESPDMALSFLKNTVDIYYSSSTDAWTFEQAPLVENFFQDALQEYCVAFYNEGCYEAFKGLSEKMMSKEANNTSYVCNVATYYLIAAEDQKKALKWYEKALKMDQMCYTAAKNCVLIARKAKNTKLEKKYLPYLIASTESEAERMAAKARLENL